MTVIVAAAAPVAMLVSVVVPLFIIHSFATMPTPTGKVFVSMRFAHPADPDRRWHGNNGPLSADAAQRIFDFLDDTQLVADMVGLH